MGCGCKGNQNPPAPSTQTSQTTQSGDIFIGYNACKTNNNILGNVIAIGYDAGAGTGADVSTSILIGKEAGKSTTSATR